MNGHGFRIYELPERTGEDTGPDAGLIHGAN
jgi:hypothetical protein